MSNVEIKIENNPFLGNMVYILFKEGRICIRMDTDNDIVIKSIDIITEKLKDFEKGLARVRGFVNNPKNKRKLIEAFGNIRIGSLYHLDEGYDADQRIRGYGGPTWTTT